MLWPKKNSYMEFGDEKKFLRLENSPPPHYGPGRGVKSNIPANERITVFVSQSQLNPSQCFLTCVLGRAKRRLDCGILSLILCVFILIFLCCVQLDLLSEWPPPGLRYVNCHFNVGSYLLVRRHLQCTEFGSYFFSGELYSQTVYENVNGFVSVHSLASDQKALRFLPTPTPLAFLRGWSACTQANIFIHATISEIKKRVCEQAEPTNTRHVNSFNKSTASCLVLKFASFFATDTFYSSLLTYVIDR